MNVTFGRASPSASSALLAAAPVLLAELGLD